MSFPGTGKIWMNGSFVEWADAKIHVASHVVHYGSGVFEGARCYSTPRGTACFRLDAHLRRLFDSAKIYRMAPAITYSALHDATLETIRVNDFKACYLRPIVYRGYDTLGVFRSEDLPDGSGHHVLRVARRHSRNDPGQRLQSVLPPADRVSRLRHARRQ